MAQTSSVLGTAVLGQFRLGVILQATDGLPQDRNADDTARANPWTTRPVASTIWTSR